MAVGAARPAIRHREPAGRRHQYRHRGGRARAADGYTLLLVGPARRDQRDALRQAQFQFHPRHRAGRGIMRVPNVMVVHPSVPAKTVPEFIAYAKANPGKINMASAGIGTAATCGRRTVQDDGRRRHGSRALSRRGARADRSARRTGAGHVRSPCRRRSNTSEPASCARSAVTTATRSEALPDIPTVGDFVPGYEASAWFGVGAPKEHARRDHRQAQQGDQRGARRSQDQGAACRPRRHGARRLARRLRQAHRRRNRKMGQGDPRGEHQARLSPVSRHRTRSRL